MPCAAGEHCKIPYQTPGPPLYTSHKCCKCNGYLHGICGAQHLLPNNGLKRLCEVACAKGRGSRSAGEDGSKKKPKAKATGVSIDKGSATKNKAGGSEKRKFLTLAEKGHLVELMIEKKMKLSHLSSTMGIPERTLSRIKNNHTALTQRLKDNPSTKNTKKNSRGAQFPEIETEVMAKITARRAVKFPVTRSTVGDFAKKARDDLIAKATSDEQRQMYASFNASVGWIKKFCKRHKLQSAGFYREAGSVHDAAMLNVGETGAFYRMPPRRTYLAPGETHMTTRDKNTEGDDGDYDKDDSEQPEGVRSPPPYEEVADIFEQLETTATECSMEEVTDLLRRTKLAWMRAYADRKRRQSDIRNFME